MKVSIVLVLAAMSVTAVFGTPQEPDRIVIDGEEGLLFENPLEELWKTPNGRRWLWGEEPWPQAGKIGAIEFRHGRPASLPSISTANCRGYVATYRIEGGRLELVRIERNCGTNAGCEPVAREVPIDRVLEGKAYPAFADWYSGRMRAAFGMYEFELGDGCYEVRYKRDVFLVIKDGVIISRTDVGNTGDNRYRTAWGERWRQYGDEGKTDGGWLDARLVEQKWLRPERLVDVSVRTRGAFFRELPDEVSCESGLVGSVAFLRIHETPDWPARVIPLHALPNGEPPVDGTLVEIECRFVKGGERQELHVSSIRELKPSEALFHTDLSEFIEKWRSEMNAARERKAAEAREAAEPAKKE